MVRRFFDQLLEGGMDLSAAEAEQKMLEDLPGYMGAFFRSHYHYLPVGNNPVWSWIDDELDRGTDQYELCAAIAQRVGMIVRIASEKMAKRNGFFKMQAYHDRMTDVITQILARDVSPVTLEKIIPTLAEHKRQRHRRPNRRELGTKRRT